MRARRNGVLLAPLPEAARRARRHTIATLGEWRLAEHVVETATLLTSELVTNAVVATAGDAVPETADHWAMMERLIGEGVAASAGSPRHGGSRPATSTAPANVAPDLYLRLSLGEGGLVIEVRDGVVRPPLRHEPEPESDGGRGMLLVDVLSRDWGWHWVRGWGKAVWCSLAIS
jgi:hypothetical protein